MSTSDMIYAIFLKIYPSLDVLKVNVKCVVFVLRSKDEDKHDAYYLGIKLNVFFLVTF